MIMILKKKQPWMMFKLQVFSMINSSSSSSSSSSISFNNVLRLRPFCSSTTHTTCPFCSSTISTTHTTRCRLCSLTTSTTNGSCCLSSVVQPPTPTPILLFNKHKQQQLNILLEKKHPLLIVPYNNVTPTKYLLRRPYRRLLDDDYGSYTCDGNLGFINLFHDDNDDDLKKKKKKQEEEEEVEVYNVYLPEIDGRRICGSSEGWLVTVHHNGEFQLLNPVTRVIVHLPPFIPFPGPVLPPNYGHRCLRDTFISKVVTNTTTNSSSTTLQPAEVATVVVVMAIFDHLGGLAFCRTAVSSSFSSTVEQEVGKTTSWITIPTKTPISLGDESFSDDITHEVIDGVTYWVYMFSDWVDVTFYKGNFYAVCCVGAVGVVKGLDGPSPFVQTLINEPETEPEFCEHMNYLVESFSTSSSGGGDLLMVMRNIEEEKENLPRLLGETETEEEEETEVETETEEEEIFKRRPYRTNGFKVWKLDLNGPAPSWEGVITDLGEDCALFVGYNHSFSFSASKIPGCKGNCIYFTDNHKDRIAYYPNGGHDIGVYNLEDGSFEKLNYETCSSSSQLFMPPPVWYVSNSSA